MTDEAPTTLKAKGYRATLLWLSEEHLNFMKQRGYELTMQARTRISTSEVFRMLVDREMRKTQPTQPEVSNAQHSNEG